MIDTGSGGKQEGYGMIAKNKSESDFSFLLCADELVGGEKRAARGLTGTHTVQ
jgi:hypothetical protein